MFKTFPYDDIAKKIASVTIPYSLDKFENIFTDISSETEIQRVHQIDIQHDLCDVYLFSPKEINEKYLPVPPAYFFYKIQSLLILGEKRFYMLIHCGKDPIITNHTFNQTVASMRTSPIEYRNISSGRFQSVRTGNFISAEGDEFDIRYILLTNSEWLLKSNEIFNFSRNFFSL
jgi:hypothetical protein